MNPIKKILGKDISKNRIGDPGESPDDRPLVDDSVLTPVSIRPSLNPALNRKKGQYVNATPWMKRKYKEQYINER